MNLSHAQKQAYWSPEWNILNDLWTIILWLISRKCKKKDTGAEYAVKIVSRRHMVQAMREANILQLCKEHRNIVKLVDHQQVNFPNNVKVDDEWG